VTSPDGRDVGRLPFIVKRKFGFTAIRMPPFTNLLGPVVDQGAGKMQTQIARRLSLVGELLDQLPRFDSFKIVLKSDGPDGLAFQDRGFSVAPHYNFRIDWRADVQEIWKEMDIKLRQHIRRAEQKFTVVSVNTPERFVEFYASTLKSRGLTNNHNFATFPDLFREARSRGAGEILCASWPDGRPAAMIFLAWDRGRTYYVLSMRAGHVGDNSVSLLLWEAIKGAHARGQAFDFDGVSTSGTLRFYANFGGCLETRLIARRATSVFEAAMRAKQWVRKGTAAEFRDVLSER
jgi:hypothetical protein